MLVLRVLVPLVIGCVLGLLVYLLLLGADRGSRL
jgi:hypothetical protein